MESAENLVLELNKLLIADQFNRREFDRLVLVIKKQFNPDIKFLDFEYFNEQRGESARREKIRNIKLQKFDIAAEWRNLELECINYIDIKTEYKIDKSIFYYDQNYLFYFYFGTARNDKTAREYIKELLDRNPYR
jgi:hypothetical protein